MKKIFVILILITFVTACNKGTINSDTIYDNNKIESDNNIKKVENFKIKNKLELNNSIIEFYDLIVEWGRIDNELEKLVMNKDLDYFKYYKLSDKKGKEVLQKAEYIFDYLDNDLSSNHSLFFNEAYARKRWSFMYYIPILGSLVKAKHKVIETSRAGVYEYLKNSLDEVDRTEKLREYNISNIEDIRQLSDDKIENLARDPELRYGIDWKKITKNLGETAVKTVVDASKTVIGGSFNPINDTIDNFKEDLKDLKLDKIGEDIPYTKGNLSIKSDNENKNKKVVLGIKKDIKRKLNKLGINEKFKTLKKIKKNEVYDKIQKDFNKTSLISINKTDIGEIDINLDIGEWDFMMSNEDIGAFSFDSIDIKEKSVTEIYLGKNDVKVNTFKIDDINDLEIENQDLGEDNNIEDSNIDKQKINKNKVELDTDTVRVLNGKIYTGGEYKMTEHEKKNGITDWSRFPRLIEYQNATLEEKQKFFPNKLKKELDNKFKYDGLWIGDAISTVDKDYCSDSIINLVIKNNKLSGSVHGGGFTLDIFGEVDLDGNVKGGFAKAKQNMVKFKGKIINNSFRGTWFDSYSCSGMFSLDKDT